MPGLRPDEWQALSPQLEKALDMTGEERVEWLSFLRKENPGQADQLERLLDQHQALERENFLNDRVIALPEKSGLSGQSIGAYTLVSEIGQGGMGTVWLAERNDGRFERRVAVKFLNIALLGKGGEERFQREGIILGRLAHPHIAELIDAGVSQSGSPYLVLEHIEGDHIDRYCDQRQLPITSRVQLFLDVVAAVDHAHTNFIVHRDLKPSNVLVSHDGCVKLLDFGIAKLLEINAKDDRVQLTVEGGRALTPEYAAPEQLTGQPVTTATDVYALGVLLYVLLTGQHPTKTVTNAPADLVKAILDREPVRPSEAVISRNQGEEQVSAAARRSTTPEKLVRLLRGDLDTVVIKAIKKNPHERYSSAKALADDLRRYLNSEPISARPDAFAYRATKFIRRHRGRVLAMFLVALTLALASATTWLLSRRLTPLKEIKQRRLTANSVEAPVLNAVLSPNGKYLGYADLHGIHVESVDTSAPVRISVPPELGNDNASRAFGGWYPDSTRFLASSSTEGSLSQVWSVSITDGKAEKVAEIEGLFESVKPSPDGSKILYASGFRNSGAPELWLMGPKGETPHRIKSAEDQSGFQLLGWSPTGSRVVYIYVRHQEDRPDISVRSCDLDGTNEATIVREPRLDAYAWTSSERFIYSRTGDPGGTESDNLWELKVDGNGVAKGPSRRVTDWSGFFVQALSGSADGKQLVFLRGSSRISTFVGEITNAGKGLGSVRDLKIDDNFNIPLAWSSDSREMIFSSKRAENRLIYSQAIDAGSPSQLVTSTPGMNFYIARLTPDRSALLLEGSPNGKYDSAIYRQDKNGNQRLLFDTNGFVQYWCSDIAANLCIFGQMASNTNDLVITKFDPETGAQRELIKIPVEPGSSARVGEDYAWQLAPDGSSIAILRRDHNWIRLLSLKSGVTKTLLLASQPKLVDLNWASNSRGLFVSSRSATGAVITYVGLNGTTRPFWQKPAARWAGVLQSPDGRHAALWSVGRDANAWMIDEF
ncbi:MAG TPA: protein kinase [Terriglobales bacterium]|nr:protein kinase [Terriglobales bacterium]